LKERVVAACAVPGASVARIALEHGLNANLVHRWRRVAEGRELGPEVKSVSAQFVSLPMATPIGSTPADIRIELKHGPTSISVTWPTIAASECATWLRELLR
jgi:transposase